ncbi:surface lipoprotein [Burkholderiales bacterium GJ-E10]|nr:surface lipoprotein [Burkholderiales bacterium GJ-E10]
MARRGTRAVALTVLAVALQGCATTSASRTADVQSAGADISDPWEPMNRKMFDLNMGLYNHVFEPLGRGYERVTPRPVRTGIAHFFANAEMPYVALNDFLQLRVHQGLSDLGRFVCNTIFGIAGLFDVAGRFDLPPHENGLGVTLGVWGLPQGPYLVLPFFGPSSLRSVSGVPAEIFLSPFYYVQSVSAQWSIATVGTINEGYTSRGAVQMVQDALSPYDFARSAWLQHQAYLVRGSDVSATAAEFPDAAPPAPQSGLPAAGTSATAPAATTIGTDPKPGSPTTHTEKR